MGAGIGGSSVALALAQVGVEVAIYERAPQIRAVGAGISLWAPFGMQPEHDLFNFLLASSR
jgi:2-polyprenyl-6-methoxyphenol hydroxylase-like FAD-dependent oxidoreductase